MAGAALALFVTDFAYSYFSVQGIVYNQAGYLEAGWATFYILWGAAALHGSMRTLSERVVDVVPRLSRGRLTILALGLVARAERDDDPAPPRTRRKTSRS